ncbi:MAG: hypothetical protein HY273_11120 [Gammaproteobacteria bacterium]|nr:hypothetical protein [Gammaproteobacteria bacterium]
MKDEYFLFCSQPQRQHFVKSNEIDGEIYFHYQPCSEQIITQWLGDPLDSNLNQRLHLSEQNFAWTQMPYRRINIETWL